MNNKDSNQTTTKNENSPREGTLAPLTGHACFRGPSSIPPYHLLRLESLPGHLPGHLVLQPVHQFRLLHCWKFLHHPQRLQALRMEPKVVLDLPHETQTLLRKLPNACEYKVKMDVNPLIKFSPIQAEADFLSRPTAVGEPKRGLAAKAPDNPERLQCTDDQEKA